VHVPEDHLTLENGGPCSKGAASVNFAENVSRGAQLQLMLGGQIVFYTGNYAGFGSWFGPKEDRLNSQI
jgi:hypothetical protein